MGDKLISAGCVVKVESSDRSTMIHYLAIGNKITDTLFILWFEAPTEKWQEDYEIGKTMLGVFIMDDEV